MFLVQIKLLTNNYPDSMFRVTQRNDLSSNQFLGLRTKERLIEVFQMLISHNYYFLSNRWQHCAQLTEKKEGISEFTS